VGGLAGMKMRTHKFPLATLVMLLFIARSAAAAQDVPLFTPELEQQLRPKCPKGCEENVPFTAVYRRDRQTLVFVATRHVLSGANRTIRAVDSGFAELSAAVVIVEGFPTALGENPSFVVDLARNHGVPAGGAYERSEMMHTLVAAISREIPFLGGEPTRAKELQVFGHGGYTRKDIAFEELVEGLGQSIRNGDLTAGVGDPRLASTFKHSAEAFILRYALEPLSFDEFSARYKLVFGVAVAEDEKLAVRWWPGTDSPVALLSQLDMNVRDRHLLAIIEKEVALKERVLVVYGSAHWITLSQALERTFGKPTIATFTE
jgi:hypothetical protein